jgi:hypothetical protein
MFSVERHDSPIWLEESTGQSQQSQQQNGLVTVLLEVLLAT